MDLFILNEEVALLEHRLAALDGLSRLDPLVTLAWHLRQRDTSRALTLATQAEALLEQADTTSLTRQPLAARLLLVRAEACLMAADLAAAQDLTQAAAHAFESLDDPIGRGDVYWLEASIAVDRGDDEQINLCLGAAIDCYRRAGDGVREQAALGRHLIYAAFRDPAATALALQESFPAGLERVPAVIPWVATAEANVAGLTNDPGKSIKSDLAAYQAALEIGQLRAALVSVCNAVEAFTVLDDLDAALEWMESALALARSTGWPGSVGVCLMQMGDVMRLLQRHDEAKACLQEALQVMSPLLGSRNYEQVLGNLGQLTLDMRDFTAGMAWFAEFEEHVKVHQEPDLLIKAWCGQARALHHLGRADEARLKAQAALDTAREHGNADGQIQALSLLAQMPLEQNAALAYLQQALDISATMKGYSAAPELLHQTAAAHAANGDFRAAYETALLAHAARNQRHGDVAQKRALAMQIEREVARARSEAQNHRQLAATLQETATTLKTLGIIGREITASLETNAIFKALHGHVNNLLDATFFAVYLLDASQQNLRTAFSVEAGVALPVISTALDHPTSMFARCARERREIVIDRDSGADDPNRIPGTLPSLSLLYSPLIVGDRLLGAMSIQSPRPHVYGERERSIFRTLCAYGAIALDNALAYGAVAAAQHQAELTLLELRQAQALLLSQNKQLEQLAITDQLTGLYNRLHLDRTLAEEYERQRRYGTSFSLLILDIDEFKAVNDKFGHPVGDQVLVGIAHILRTNVRQVDVVGRWGGEEFLVMCRETALEGALLMAEKLRLAIECHVFEAVGRKSASVGVAAFRPGETVIETIKRADAALYQAKQAGRNRVAGGAPTAQ